MTEKTENDQLYQDAVGIVLKHNHSSISLVQRRLNIGYNHAARLIERMEKDGIVSPMNMNGFRSVIKGKT